MLKEMYAILVKDIKNNSYMKDSNTLVLGNLIELHFSEDFDNIDVYKYASDEAMEADDYDFDEAKS